MTVFLFVFVVSCLLLWGIWATSNSPAVVCGIAAIATIFFCSIPFMIFAWSFALILQPALTFLFVGLSALFQSATKRGLTPKSTFQLALTAMIVSYALALCAGLATLPERARVRAKYPLQSLASRLEYETKSPGK